MNSRFIQPMQIEVNRNIFQRKFQFEIVQNDNLQDKINIRTTYVRKVKFITLAKFSFINKKVFLEFF